MKVQSRPWEWVNYMEEPRHATTCGDGPQVRNDTSIPLELFQARIIAERSNPPQIPPMTNEELEEVVMKRYARDRFNDEDIYERDWKETRAGTLSNVTGGSSTHRASEAADGGQSSDDEATHDPPISRRGDQQSMSMEDARSSMASGSGLSPATRASSSSRNPNDDRGVIDVDALPGPEHGTTGRGRKRKATNTSANDGAVEVVDDDIEIIEPTSALAATLRSQRGRGKSTGGKGKGKRRA